MFLFRDLNSRSRICNWRLFPLDHRGKGRLQRVKSGIYCTHVCYVEGGGLGMRNSHHGNNDCKDNDKNNHNENKYDKDNDNANNHKTVAVGDKTTRIFI